MSILKRIFRKSNKKATTMENTPNQEVKTDLINEEKKTMEETKEDLKQKPEGKNRIYNLIIVDESGSMHSLRDATLSGINETINTIKGTKKGKDTKTELKTISGEIKVVDREWNEKTRLFGICIDNDHHEVGHYYVEKCEITEEREWKENDKGEIITGDWKEIKRGKVQQITTRSYQF